MLSNMAVSIKANYNVHNLLSLGLISSYPSLGSNVFIGPSYLKQPLSPMHPSSLLLVAICVI